MAEITQIDLGQVVGATGATGATGPTGPQGPGATISVGSVTTTTYGNPAQVTNSGTATDAVLDFVIPQGAPGEEVTDVSSLTLNSITETAASFPVPAVGDVMSVVMGKVKKFFADTVAALNTKLNKANVVNDLTYTAEGYALDARAGKTLKTQIDSLNDSFAGQTVNTSIAIYHKFGRIVIIRLGSIQNVTLNAWTTYEIDTIPTGFAPTSIAAYFVLPMQGRTDIGGVYLRANTNGKLELSNQTNSVITIGATQQTSVSWLV